MAWDFDVVDKETGLKLKLAFLNWEGISIGFYVDEIRELVEDGDIDSIRVALENILSVFDELTAPIQLKEAYWIDSPPQEIIPLALNTLKSRWARPDEKELALRILSDEPSKPVDESANDKEREKAGFIYVLKADNDLYKIGRAKALDDRIKQIKPKLPYATELVCTIKVSDYVKTENQIHELLADAGKHIRGEWFELNEADIHYIKSLEEFHG